MRRARTSVRDALDGAVTALGAGGCETPRLDAELLTAHVLGVDRARLLTDSELAVEGPAARALQAAVRRRAVDREPVAYIIGARHFRRLELRVDHRALIPRPESELLVEVALTAPAGASVLDLCTGSGAVALAVKDERPDLAVTGSDISAPALALARENAARLGLEVSLVQADLLDGLDDRYDLVLANPPYVADGDRASLAPEITRHEPSLALFAGADGLDVVRRIYKEAGARPGLASLAVEVADGQAEHAAALARQAGFTAVSKLPDLAGTDRVVIAARPGKSPTGALIA